tara:strand:- start:91569 stop:91676 length:108 start_codon:yes stop_codon:yes gene_type:complete
LDERGLPPASTASCKAISPYWTTPVTDVEYSSSPT